MKRILFIIILLHVMIFAQGAGRYLNNSEVSQSFKERYFSKGEHDFFPMHVGDLWQYVYYDHDNDTLEYFENKIIKDTLVNNLQFFKMIKDYYLYYYRTDNEGVLRVLDTYDYDNDGITDEEFLGDSLDVPYQTMYHSYFDIVHIVRDTMWYVIDNDTLFTRMVFTMGGELFYTDKIGLTMMWPEQNEPIYLTGAIINGVTHGTLVGVEDEPNGIKPAKFELEQNYPNPFNPTTNITYVIASGAKQSQQLLANNEIASSQAPRNDNIRLTVYDALGRKVATLVNKKQAPGNYTVQFDASKLSSGIYFYTLRAGNFSATKKMILMK